VEALLALGYQVPATLDAEGNQDGFVCGRPLPPQQCGDDCPVPHLFLFSENIFPPNLR
jgi:hypothetical protein